MKNAGLFLFILFVCLNGGQEVFAQSKSGGETIGKYMSKKDTIVKARTESYRFEKGFVVKNVKNVLNVIPEPTNRKNIRIKNDHFLADEVYKKVFSPDRMTELKESFLGSIVVCDSTGNIKEVVFVVGKALNLTLEEIEMLEQALKKFKLDFNNAGFEIEYFRFILPCKMSKLLE